MKRGLLLSAAALILFAASPVLADSHDHHDAGTSGTPAAGGSSGAGHGDHKGSTGTVHTLSGTGTMSGTTGHTGQMGTGGNNPFNGAATGGAMTGTTHHEHHFNTGGTNPTVQGDLNRHTNNGVNVFTPNTHGGQNGARGFHEHNGNFDSLRRVLNAEHRFHVGGYHRPHGWYAHRWTYGEFLPSFFFTRNYWIDDWDNYGLYDPPPGTVWVRDGDDALLIDEYSGEVIQVVYGIFY